MNPSQELLNIFLDWRPFLYLFCGIYLITFDIKRNIHAAMHGDEIEIISNAEKKFWSSQMTYVVDVSIMVKLHES